MLLAAGKRPSLIEPPKPKTGEVFSPNSMRRRSSLLSKFILSRVASPDVDTSEDDADSPRALRLPRFSHELVRRSSSRSPLSAPAPFFVDEEPSTRSALQEVILNKDSRQLLINSLLEVKGEHVQKIRFVSCVDEFQQLPASKNKSDKGRDIYRFFLCDRALFRCTGAPERYVTRASNGVYDDYAAIRAVFLEQLASHDDVRQAVDKIW